jgi:hypothetical protein
MALELRNRGAGLLRFRVDRRFAAHKPTGNSVRVWHEPGPVARGMARLLHVEVLARDVGMLADTLPIITPDGNISVPVSARVVVAAAAAGADGVGGGADDAPATAMVNE